jgi:hypothetical protein
LIPSLSDARGGGSVTDDTPLASQPPALANEPTTNTMPGGSAAQTILEGVAKKRLQESVRQSHAGSVLRKRQAPRAGDALAQYRPQRIPSLYKRVKFRKERIFNVYVQILTPMVCVHNSCVCHPVPRWGLVELRCSPRISRAECSCAQRLLWSTTGRHVPLTESFPF